MLATPTGAPRATLNDFTGGQSMTGATPTNLTTNYTPPPESTLPFNTVATPGTSPAPAPVPSATAAQAQAAIDYFNSAQQDELNEGSGSAAGNGRRGGRMNHGKDSAGGAVSPDSVAQGFDAGGAASGQLTPGAYSGNPLAANMYQQFSSLPMEKLQELSMRYPPGSPQGAVIQSALRQKQMNPQAGQQPAMGAPAAPATAQAPAAAQAPQGAQAVPVGQQPMGQARGGVARGFDDGGDTDAVNPYSLPTESAAEGLTDWPAFPLSGAAPAPSDSPRPPKGKPLPHQTAGQSLNQDFGPSGQSPTTWSPTYGGPWTSDINIPFSSPNANASARAPAQAQNRANFANAVSSFFSPQPGNPNLASRFRPPPQAATPDPDITATNNAAHADLDRPTPEPSPPATSPGGGQIMNTPFTPRAVQVSDDPAVVVSQDGGEEDGAPLPPDMPASRAAGMSQSVGTSSGMTPPAGAGSTKAPTSSTAASAPAAPPWTPGKFTPNAARQQTTSEKLAASPWTALMAAGLGIMASRSPYPMVAIGEGGMQGVKALNQQAVSARANAEQENKAQYQDYQEWLGGQNLDKSAADLSETAKWHSAQMDKDQKQLQIEQQNAGVNQQRANTEAGTAATVQAKNNLDIALQSGAMPMMNHDGTTSAAIYDPVKHLSSTDQGQTWHAPDFSKEGMPVDKQTAALMRGAYTPTAQMKDVRAFAVQGETPQQTMLRLNSLKRDPAALDKYLLNVGAGLMKTGNYPDLPSANAAARAGYEQLVGQSKANPAASPQANAAGSRPPLNQILPP
jgi:hypothetical protein